MARRKSPTLTDAELRLMQVLWKRGFGTVGDVVASLSEWNAPAYSTVLTTLRILEQKGYVRHEKDGRAFVYYPVVGQNDARRSVIQYVMSRFFDNSPALLLMNLLEEGEIDAEDLARIQKRLQDFSEDSGSTTE